ncbi:CPCC family cysteine-rich protein [Allosphingosinicella indica]
MDHACPVCAQSVFSDEGSYEICVVCGWEHDPTQGQNADLSGGANNLSLNEARRVWESGKQVR